MSVHKREEFGLVQMAERRLADSHGVLTAYAPDHDADQTDEMARPQHGQNRFAPVGADAAHLHPARPHDQAGADPLRRPRKSYARLHR